MATQLSFGFDDQIYSTSVAAVVVETLAREGIAAHRALLGVGVTTKTVHSSQTRMSATQYVHLYRNALKLTRDPQFALHAGQRMHLAVYGIFGFAILTSPTFRQALDVAQEYYQLAAPLVEVRFNRERGRGVWCLRPEAHKGVDADLARFLCELYVSSGVALHREMFGASFTPLEVHFVFAAPREQGKYRQLLGCPVSFRQSQTQLIFDAAIIDQHNERGSAVVHGEAIRLCHEWINRLQQEAGFAGRVRQELSRQQSPVQGLLDVAKRLSLSPRTLRRKLSGENASFCRLANEYKMRSAARYLRDTPLPVEEIGRALGFSESRSFRRAFERWAGVSPARFRSRLKGRGYAC